MDTRAPRSPTLKHKRGVADLSPVRESFAQRGLGHAPEYASAGTHLHDYEARHDNRLNEHQQQDYTPYTLRRLETPRIDAFENERVRLERERGVANSAIDSVSKPHVGMAAQTPTTATFDSASTPHSFNDGSHVHCRTRSNESPSKQDARRPEITASRKTPMPLMLQHSNKTTTTKLSTSKSVSRLLKDEAKSASPRRKIFPTFTFSKSNLGRSNGLFGGSKDPVKGSALQQYNGQLPEQVPLKARALLEGATRPLGSGLHPHFGQSLNSRNDSLRRLPKSPSALSMQLQSLDLAGDPEKVSPLINTDSPTTPFSPSQWNRGSPFKVRDEDKCDHCNVAAANEAFSPEKTPARAPNNHDTTPAPYEHTYTHRNPFDPKSYVCYDRPPTPPSKSTLYEREHQRELEKREIEKWRQNADATTSTLSPDPFTRNDHYNDGFGSAPPDIPSQSQPARLIPQTVSIKSMHGSFYEASKAGSTADVTVAGSRLGVGSPAFAFSPECYSPSIYQSMRHNDKPTQGSRETPSARMFPSPLHPSGTQRSPSLVAKSRTVAPTQPTTSSHEQRNGSGGTSKTGMTSGSRSIQITLDSPEGREWTTPSHTGAWTRRHSTDSAVQASPLAAKSKGLGIKDENTIRVGDVKETHYTSSLSPDALADLKSLVSSSVMTALAAMDEKSRKRAREIEDEMRAYRAQEKQERERDALAVKRELTQMCSSIESVQQLSKQKAGLTTALTSIQERLSNIESLLKHIPELNDTLSSTSNAMRAFDADKLHEPLSRKLSELTAPIQDIVPSLQYIHNTLPHDLHSVQRSLTHLPSTWTHQIAVTVTPALESLKAAAANTERALNAIMRSLEVLGVRSDEIGLQLAHMLRLHGAGHTLGFTNAGNAFTSPSPAWTAWPTAATAVASPPGSASTHSNAEHKSYERTSEPCDAVAPSRRHRDAHAHAASISPTRRSSSDAHNRHAEHTRDNATANSRDLDESIATSASAQAPGSNSPPRHRHRRHGTPNRRAREYHAEVRDDSVLQQQRGRAHAYAHVHPVLRPPHAQSTLPGPLTSATHGPLIELRPGRANH